MFEYKVVLEGSPVKITRYREDMRAWFKRYDARYREEGLSVRYFQKTGYMGTWAELAGEDI
jgi:hypothetical protein